MPLSNGERLARWYFLYETKQPFRYSFCNLVTRFKIFGTIYKIVRKGSNGFLIYFLSITRMGLLMYSERQNPFEWFIAFDTDEMTPQMGQAVSRFGLIKELKRITPTITIVYFSTISDKGIEYLACEDTKEKELLDEMDTTSFDWNDDSHLMTIQVPELS
jgi:hypothetical protein